MGALCIRVHCVYVYIRYTCALYCIFCHKALAMHFCDVCGLYLFTFSLYYALSKLEIMRQNVGLCH